jgi:hypothetical protein
MTFNNIGGFVANCLEIGTQSSFRLEAFGSRPNCGLHDQEYSDKGLRSLSNDVCFLGSMIASAHGPGWLPGGRFKVLKSSSSCSA